ncbi:hypothetical protein VCUG_00226 [Vavraia culicis subsp. floridensis]|uniref:Uncharacterized protein n=1 Tax=Vavraia culicis (isolate floridensis) TaxID=948595 RepID=L2GZ96_VAVCU|nr:uncharacterized protein VCUG_00226 [Vavraia culicis subsp. floridensis]ELA48390.1 hypothetical protein VCUG_00226 [Vavraia culicis subsp. floridensis]
MEAANNSVTDIQLHSNNISESNISHHIPSWTSGIGSSLESSTVSRILNVVKKRISYTNYSFTMFGATLIILGFMLALMAVVITCINSCWKKRKASTRKHSAEKT